MSEAQRQQALMKALTGGAPDPDALALRETGVRAARGLDAYRANAQMLADRALSAAFATVQAMVGADDFRQLAREFWRAHPPLRGDLGEWGDAFAPWLDAHPWVSDWPWLGDSARLDLALHRCERAADAAFDAASLALLASADPAQLRLELMPGTAVLGSAWPIAAIHHAHRLEGDAAERAFELVREAIAQSRGDQVLVARKGWRAAAFAVTPVDAVWLRTLLDGASLAHALLAAGEQFDFSAWLATALRESWVKGVAVASDE